MTYNASGLQMGLANARVNEFSTDVALAGNSDVAIPTEKAVKAYVDAQDHTGGGAGSDTTAIHDNVASEISVITEKATPVSADLLIIEDSAASNVKKRLQIGNLPAPSLALSGLSDVTMTGAQMEGFLLFGSGNIVEVPCVYGYQYLLTRVSLLSGIINPYATGTTYMTFTVPLPTTRGGKSLYIKNVYVALSDADGNNYIDFVRVYGELYTGATLVLNHNTNMTTIAKHTATNASADNMGSYDVVFVYLSISSTATSGIDLHGITIDCYYA